MIRIIQDLKRVKRAWELQRDFLTDKKEKAIYDDLILDVECLIHDAEKDLTDEDR